MPDPTGPNLKEMCQEFDSAESEARRVLALPEEIYEAVKNGESTGSSSRDKLVDFTVLRNREYHSGLAAAYLALQDLVAENVGARVIMTRVIRSGLIYPGDPTRLSIGHASIKTGTINSNNLQVEHCSVPGFYSERADGHVAVQTGGYKEYRYYNPEESPRYANHGEEISRSGNLPIDDYDDTFQTSPPIASALIEPLSVDIPWDDDYRGTRVVLTAQLWVGDITVEEALRGQAEEHKFNPSGIDAEAAALIA